MSLVKNSLIVQKGERHANMTELNHLGVNLQVKPVELETQVMQMFSATQYYSENALMAGQYGKERTIDSLEWTWKLRNSSSRPLTCMGNVEPSSLIKLGEHGQPFMIYLDEDWLKPGDNITPGTSSKRYTLRIVDKGIPKDKGFLYKVRMPKRTDSFPSSLLKAGQTFGKLYSNYEEGAADSGSVVFGNDVAFKNSMSLLRKSYKITNFASTAVLSTYIQTSEGPMKSWVSYAEAEFMRQWYMEKEMLVWYGEKTSDVFGSTGRPIVSGPGIEEMIEADGNVIKPAQFSANLIEEFIVDGLFNKRAFKGGDSIKAYSGMYGMLGFHRAFDDIWKKKGMTIIQSNFNAIEATKSNYHSNAYSYGYMFTKFKMFNGQELELIHLPIYDNTDIHKEIDPVTGRLMESQKITFLDFSENSDGRSNVEIMKKKDGYTFDYVCGLYCPTGPTSKSSKFKASHEGSYYSMVIEDTFGVHIGDIKKCGQIRIGRAS